jgi:hypothetical protein
MKNPIIIISLTTIALATIAATVVLVITGHDAGSILAVLSAGTSLTAASAGILSMQAQNATTLSHVAKSVNGNTSTLIGAALASGSLDAATIAGLSQNNAKLTAVVTPAP